MDVKKTKSKVPLVEPKEKADGKISYVDSDLVDLKANEASKLGQISRQTRLMQIAMQEPDLIAILLEEGMHCIGCPASAFESLEEGCRAHGFNEEKINRIVLKLNTKLQEKRGGKKE